MDKDKTKRHGRKTRYPGVVDLGSGSFRIRAYFTDPATGRQREKERLIEAKSATEAADRKRELEVELATKGGNESSELNRLGDVAEAWLKRKVEAKRPESKGGGSRLCPTTHLRYKQAVKHHIVPYFKEHIALKVTKRDVEEWRDHLGAHYAAATVNGHLRVLRMILVDSGNTRAAEASALAEDDTRITEDEPNLLDDDELGRFLTIARDDFAQHYAFILVLMTTAMRFSTAIVLRREDFDPARGVIVARRRRSGKEIIPGVKRSRTAKDVVPLLPEVWSVVQAHWAQFNAKQLESGLAFPGGDGGVRARSHLDKPFRTICEKAGIKQRFTPHGCRRTSVDRYRRVAGSVVSMSIAGHLTTKMHERYSFARPAEKQAAGALAFGALALASGKTGDVTGDEGVETQTPD